MSGGEPICAMELMPMEGDIPMPILAAVDMLELLLTPSRESEKSIISIKLYLHLQLFFSYIRVLQVICIYHCINAIYGVN
jgi:hypothetical protein